MIVTLAADDAHRLLTVIAEGPIDFEAIRECLVNERTDAALGYGEVIDACWSCHTGHNTQYAQ